MEQFTITELSSGNIGSTLPQLFAENVVWQSEVDGDDEIFFYNGSETVQLTDNVEGILGFQSEGVAYYALPLDDSEI